MVIEIKNLSHTYMPDTVFSKTAVSNVNLKIEQGEFIGLIGHSGSGKSTLIQHLNGLIKATEGEIRLSLRMVFTVGYLFDSNSTLPSVEPLSTTTTSKTPCCISSASRHFSKYLLPFQLGITTVTCFIFSFPS